MGVFVGHEPCPKCGSRDNLARYQDGGAFCFGCRYSEPPKQFAPQPTVKEEDLSTLLPTDLTKYLPEVNQAWLKQYLSDGEINEYFEYSSSLKRHVYRHINEFNGAVYWEARSVKRTPEGMFTYESPKTISRGSKPFFLMGPWRSTHKVVVVEDIVSAIKIARHAGVFPLFGSHMKPVDLLKIVKIAPILNVVIWLDRDKYKEALSIADRMCVFKTTTVVSTDDDPKALSDDDIKELLEL